MKERGKDTWREEGATSCGRSLPWSLNEHIQCLRTTTMPCKIAAGQQDPGRNGSFHGEVRQVQGSVAVGNCANAMLCKARSTLCLTQTGAVQSQRCMHMIGHMHACKHASTRSTLSDRRKANSSHLAFAGERPADVGDFLYGPAVMTPVNSAC